MAKKSWEDFKRVCDDAYDKLGLAMYDFETAPKESLKLLREMRPTLTSGLKAADVDRSELPLVIIKELLEVTLDALEKYVKEYARLKTVGNEQIDLQRITLAFMCGFHMGQVDDLLQTGGRNWFQYVRTKMGRDAVREAKRDKAEKRQKAAQEELKRRFRQHPGLSKDQIMQDMAEAGTWGSFDTLKKHYCKGIRKPKKGNEPKLP